MRNYLTILLTAAFALPWIFVRFSGFAVDPTTEALLAGLAIFGAAFLLSWAAEVAQLEISAALAVAILSLIAVLPEYSVDIYFAWKAGQDPAYAHYAVANMTGANRLLIGLGWSGVVLLFWWRSGQKVLHFRKQDAVELGALLLATAYAVLIPLKGTISLVDSLVLIGLFVVYIRATARQEVHEPELMGPAAALARLGRSPRRLVTALLFIYAAGAILVSAEPFAEGLVETGKLLGIDEFFLVQWLAPLASEAPEFIVASLFVLQGKARLGVRALISSKVNQWTLLVGMLPLAYALSTGSLAPLPLDQRQVQEVLLTVAQSAFAVAILTRLDFTVWAAISLAVLFVAQLVFLEYHLLFSVIYLVMAVLLLVTRAERVRGVGLALRALLQPEGAKE